MSPEEERKIRTEYLRLATRFPEADPMDMASKMYDFITNEEKSK